MDATTIVLLSRRIQEALDCECQFLRFSPVRHLYKGRTLWSGDVAVFAIQRSSGSDVCFAWLDDGGLKLASPAIVLKSPTICTPELAVESHIRGQCQETEM